MGLLVLGNLGDTASDPSWVTGGLEVLVGELSKGVGAGVSGEQSITNVSAYSLKLVLEVLEGQGILQDLDVGGARHGHVGGGAVVHPLHGGDGRRSEDGSKSEESREHHLVVVIGLGEVGLVICSKVAEEMGVMILSTPIYPRLYTFVIDTTTHAPHRRDPPCLVMSTPEFRRTMQYASSSSALRLS